MTDKEKLLAIRAEIERLKAEQLTIFSKGEDEDSCGNALTHIGAYNQLLSFINSLLEEPVSEDLEEAVNTYIGYPPEVDECSSVYGKRQAFKAGAQWQEKKLTKKAVKWLTNNKEHPFIGCEDHQLAGYLTDNFIENFRKAMEEDV